MEAQNEEQIGIGDVERLKLPRVYSPNINCC